MYLSIDKEDSVKKRDIVAIFDMDTATFSPTTRAFLKKAEKEKRVDSQIGELPKSFVLECKKPKKSLTANKKQAKTPPRLKLIRFSSACIKTRVEEANLLQGDK